MRAEGRLMLTSVVADLSRISGLNVSVALCNPAIASLTRLSNYRVVEIPDSESADDAIQSIAKLCDDRFDFVLPIAPESGGLLTSLVSGLRQLQPKVSLHAVLAPSINAIKLCSDKWATFLLLAEHSVPAIPTVLSAGLRQLQIASDSNVVVKPRDGAGGEGICRMPLSEATERFERTPSESECNTDRQQTDGGDHVADGEYIVQPFLSGTSLSIAMIGQGREHRPLILPLAQQTIEWNNNQPRYTGGQIPASASEDTKMAARSIAIKIGDILQICAGYVGIDLLLLDDEKTLLVTEINPRLCSSYVGYRLATGSNLAEAFMKPVSADSLSWNTQPTMFDVFLNNQPKQ